LTLDAAVSSLGPRRATLRPSEHFRGDMKEHAAGLAAGLKHLPGVEV
jgi:hypothetical protein